MRFIYIELLKVDIELIVRVLEDLFFKVSKLEEILEDWDCNLIVKFFKKGNFNDCGNWCGIIFVFVVVKVLGRVIILDYMM